MGVSSEQMDIVLDEYGLEIVVDKNIMPSMVNYDKVIGSFVSKNKQSDNALTLLDDDGWGDQEWYFDIDAFMLWKDELIAQRIIKENDFQKNSKMIQRWDAIKDKLSQKHESLTLGTFPKVWENDKLYDDYDEIGFYLENNCQHQDFYFYTVIGYRYDGTDNPINYEAESIFVADDYEEMKKFIYDNPFSLDVYYCPLKCEIEWDEELLENLEYLTK